VLQREQWRLAVGALVPLERDDFARFRRVWAAKQRLGLPDQVFVHVVSEAKPFCIDFTSFLSVELLAHVVREQQEILVVEMLPTAEGLWFQDEGGRYCTEFRALAYRT